MMGFLYSVVPDSVIYPIMLVYLLPIAGFNGVWLSFGANGLIFMVLLYLIRSMRNKTTAMSWDRFLCLDETVRDNVPMLDISIHSDNLSVSGISRKVHHFLEGVSVSPRTAYVTALCLEELAADFVAHSNDVSPNANKEIMDIKLFSDKDRLRIVIRSNAKPYNPLDFDLNKETFSKAGVKMAQKLAQRIEYSHVYKMNFVNIDIDK